jgi:hypothetical protein
MMKTFFNTTQSLKNGMGQIVIERDCYISLEENSSDKVDINIVDVYGYITSKNMWLMCGTSEVEAWLRDRVIKIFSPIPYPLVFCCAVDYISQSGIVVESGMYKIFEQQYSIKMESLVARVIIPKNEFSTLMPVK